eukprot:CAMPEP_0174323040 /NCGR_PEP_ID=MMETSP0810-20121108/11492_1 /TAXON_ID=73025 ORGANISM="Eutreptiella gymnastica-like, Strain CCMP1594" /NCGR_SAMPLE_ID=MMETSP0810 /ASSEMBLY_ACC=CAM_ASM_000659 /LENGTH=345 /DNA_ID=CAMNT_0015435235 /DNA_START=20 /DNA_END=1057 /DNA_ORIENTATION=-
MEFAAISDRRRAALVVVVGLVAFLIGHAVSSPRSIALVRTVDPVSSRSPAHRQPDTHCRTECGARDALNLLQRGAPRQTASVAINAGHAASTPRSRRPTPPRPHPVPAQPQPLLVAGVALAAGLIVRWLRARIAAPDSNRLQSGTTAACAMFGAGGYKSDGRRPLTLYDYLTRTPWRRWLRALRASAWLHGAADTELIGARAVTHGRGVFARRTIVSGTVLGYYPGVRRPPWEAMDKTLGTEGRSQFYFIMCRDGWLLDPTDAGGYLLTDPAAVWYGPFRRNAMLALINEASADPVARSDGANCEVEEMATGVFEVRATRTIEAAEEVLIDYGETYGSRDHYGSA